MVNRPDRRGVRAYGAVAAIGLALLAGCQSYGSGPQPKTRQAKLDACGVLPAGYQERIRAQQQAYAIKHLSGAELRTVKIDVDQAYRARSYRGLLNRGRYKYGWAAPVSISWTQDDGKARTIRDTLLLFPGEIEAPAAASIPGLQIEKVE